MTRNGFVCGKVIIGVVWCGVVWCGVVCDLLYSVLPRVITNALNNATGAVHIFRHALPYIYTVHD